MVFQKCPFNEGGLLSVASHLFSIEDRNYIAFPIDIGLVNVENNMPGITYLILMTVRFGKTYL